MIKDLIILDENSIKDKMYYIRGKMVMIDSDLAEIYGYTTMRFNEQVKNNINRFDDDFRFQLTKDEYKNLISKKSISSWGGVRKLPYAFTEEGIYMLMTVLKGEKAVKQSKALIRIFKSMKDFLVNNKILEQEYINNMVLEHNVKIDKLFNELEPKFKNKIFFKGETYDAYSLLLDILKEAKEEIIIIDNYADKKILDLINKTNKEVILISKNINEELIKKYQSQYDNLTIKYKDDIHDRFIIIDKKILYHLGCSLKDLGNKCFGINLIQDNEYINLLLNKLKK